MIKAVIIDDEQHSIDTLKWKLENYCTGIEVAGSFNDPAEGIRYLKENPPDILFLDIEMPLLNGFDVLEEMGPGISYDIIFITAYDNFGIQAVKSGALDYLLKPVQNKELKDAIEKHLRKKAGRTSTPTDNKPKIGKIQLPSRESIEFVEPKDIVCCEANSNYTNIFLSDGSKRVISKTLREFEESLMPFQFFRPHHSYLVNLNHVKEFVRGDGGYLVMENKMKVPVSKSKRDELMSIFG